MKALCYLCQLSIEIKQKAMQTKQKEEMAEVVDEELVICEDEAEDHGIDLDSDDDESDWGEQDEEDRDEVLYDSPMDQLDEVLNLGTHL